MAVPWLSRPWTSPSEETPPQAAKRPVGNGRRPPPLGEPPAVGARTHTSAWAHAGRPRAPEGGQQPRPHSELGVGPRLFVRMRPLSAHTGATCPNGRSGAPPNRLPPKQTLRLTPCASENYRKGSWLNMTFALLPGRATSRRPCTSSASTRGHARAASTTRTEGVARPPNRSTPCSRHTQSPNPGREPSDSGGRSAYRSTPAGRRPPQADSARRPPSNGEWGTADRAIAKRRPQRRHPGSELDCDGTVLVLHRCSTGAILVLRSVHAGTALVLHTYCRGTAVVLHSYCAGTRALQALRVPRSHKSFTDAAPTWHQRGSNSERMQYHGSLSTTTPQCQDPSTCEPLTAISERSFARPASTQFGVASDTLGAVSTMFGAVSTR